MVEDYRKEDFERLKSEVETLVGRKIASPKDFAFLMRQIHGYTQETIVVTIRYKGNDSFEVVEVQNSKLSVNDTFTCHQFVADEPLYLSNLNHPDVPPCNYVAGQNGGIKWNIIDK